MRDIPIEVILSWPTPNYVDPVTQGSSLIIVNAIFIPLVVLAVSLRFYTRVYLKKWVGNDDILIGIATLFTLALNTACILANVRYFWDRHIWDIPLSALPSFGKIVIAAKVLFVAASFFTRCSLLSFYYRLTADTGLAKYKMVLHWAMACNVGILIALTPLSIFLCKPVSAYWTLGQSDKCIDEGTVTLTAGIINCVADLTTTLLPIPMIMRLKMPMRERIGVVLLLSLGFIVTIAGIIRTYFIWKSLIESYDETWYAYPLWICAAVEIDLAVLCACAPALRPLFIAYAKPLISSITSMSNSSTGHRSHLRSLGGLSSGNSHKGHSKSGGQNLHYEKSQGSQDEDELVDFKDMMQPGSRRSKAELDKKWEIEETHTFEVHYEDRVPPRRMSSSNAGYENDPHRRSDPYSNWQLQNRPRTDQGPRSESRGSWTSDVQIGRAFGPSTINSQAPILPSLRALSPMPPLGERASAPLKSFFISQPSIDGDIDTLKEEDTPSIPELERPLRSYHLSRTRGELRNGEQRWSIERKPSNGSQQRPGDKQDVIRPPRSAGAAAPRRSRWHNEPSALWEEIHSQKRDTSWSRPGSSEQMRDVS